ncbi:MAG: type II secretion system F family protein [Stellaceae bacterium]
MPRYRYRALRRSGGEIEGELVAADEREAALHLQADGSLPIEIAPQRPTPRVAVLRRRHALGARERILFTSQLAALLSAGVALDRALAVVAGDRRNPRRARAASGFLAAIERGESLSHALADGPSFSAAYVTIVAAGEARGDLAAALERNAAVLERNRAIGQSFANALIYPASVFVVACLSIGFLLAFVVPRFAVLLQSFRHAPPLAMRLLLGASSLFSTTALPLLLLTLLIAAYGAMRWRDPRFRVRIARAAASLPAIGTLLRKLEAERLSFLLGTMIEAGIALPAALSAAQGGTGNEAMRQGLAQAARSLERGERITPALAATGFVPDLALELVRIGEETGDLAPMLLKASSMLHAEIEATATEWIALVAPLSMVALGLIIGAIALAMFSTVLDVYDIAS